MKSKIQLAHVATLFTAFKGFGGELSAEGKSFGDQSISGQPIWVESKPGLRFKSCAHGTDVSAIEHPGLDTFIAPGNYERQVKGLDSLTIKRTNIPSDSGDLNFSVKIINGEGTWDGDYVLASGSFDDSAFITDGKAFPQFFRFDNVEYHRTGPFSDDYISATIRCLSDGSVGPLAFYNDIEGGASAAVTNSLVCEFAK